MRPELLTTRATWEIAVAFALWGLAFLSILRQANKTPGDKERRTLKTVVRILFATSLFFLFLEPQLRRSINRPAPVAVVLDDSASITRPLDDGYVRARVEGVAAELSAAFKRDNRPFSTRFLSGANDFSYALHSPLDDVTRLTRDVHDVLLLTDGIANPKIRSPLIANATTRVYPIVLGSSKPALNWRLSNVKPTFSGTAGGAASVTATLDLFGESGPRSALVELWRQNGKDAPSLVRSETFNAPAADHDGARKLELRLSWPLESHDDQTWALLVVDQADAANHTLERLTAAPTDGERLAELCLADNAASFSLGRDEKKTRVLLVDDLPRYEYRYLRETLRREPTVELNTILLAADSEVAQSDPIAVDVASLDRRALAEYDVVIVGDLTHEQWQRTLSSLVDVVEHEGSTTSIWFAGAMRLGATQGWQTFPEARLAPGKPVVTSPENEIDATWRLVPSPMTGVVWPEFDPQSAPELTQVVASVKPDEKTAILLFAQRSDDVEPTPLVLAASLGKNAVLWQSTDETWRLQTLSDKSIYRSFVLRSLDYLTNSARREADSSARLLGQSTTSAGETADPFSYFAQDNTTRRATIRELENVAADVETPGTIAEATGGQTLDLRDLSQEESLIRTRLFCNELNEKFAVAPTDVQTSLVPSNLLYPFVILLFILTFVLSL